MQRDLGSIRGREPLQARQVFVSEGVRIELVDSAGALSRHAQAVTEAIKVSRPLFGKAPKELRIVVVNSAAEWAQHTGPYAHLEKLAWGVTLDNGDVVVKSSQYAGIEPERFQRLLSHEMNHAFWVRNFPSVGWSPIWVVEGLANLVAPARDLMELSVVASRAKTEKLDASVLEYAYRDPVSKEELVFLYSLWRAFVVHLSPGSDTSRLMRCVSEFAKQPSRQAFDAEIRREYGKPLDLLFAEFLDAASRD